ncbi:hypothetical protein FOXG_17258 [Fusarium oxysporum f. sp. lycopersici 4287]|nr:hypothetical protein FOXG_17258 [Fusarium oxysporum f. sp. lycopersici 4287]EWZ78904.1 hypothetical protein FOWG_16909 [Fusarium oxysporum f. sp. lycopersici MN25]KAJ9413709.1 hypothetical protein QL093DRAFT_2089970 [Fusarium oxysporum]KNB20008.1 hypothetical protein FOXG_17258 [Fusarium oxysporum f. sp. lycopersici 4287]
MDRIDDELSKATAELKHVVEGAVRQERRDIARGGIRTEAGEVLRDTGPISEEILLIEELSAPTHDRSQGQKKRGTRKPLPTEACTADRGTSNTLAPSISMKANPAGPELQSAFSGGCDHCSHKPEGDPRWFRSNLARHMKLRHPDKYRQSPALNLEKARGPTRAANPLVVRQDRDGVQWIAFEYSIDRVKKQFTIRCDIEAVDTEQLSPEFKEQNCVYPRACDPKDQYRGNRLMYETECNRTGWALAKLNVPLQGKRGLLQRAVDSWRNSSKDHRLKSRRVRSLVNDDRRQNGSGPPHRASLQQSR